MVTKRTPKKAAGKIKITDRAVALFKEMRALPFCTCEWGPMYWERNECPSCERWWELHGQLHHALQLKVWEWPVIDHPPGAPPHDEIAGGRKHRRWMSYNGGRADWDEDGQLFKQLMAAAGERDEKVTG